MSAARLLNSPMTVLAVTITVLVLTFPARAQSSASYSLEAQVFNAGGNPAPVLASASYHMSLDSIGDTVAAGDLSSASYGSTAGLPPTYPPPREVQGNRFTGKDTLVWLPDPSVGTYDVYKGTVANFSPDFGSCLASGLTSEQAALDPADLPPPGQCFFYLITARNRLGEEGTKGYQSSGAERPNPSPCP